jgi:hypothetical protein
MSIPGEIAAWWTAGAVVLAVYARRRTARFLGPIQPALVGSLMVAMLATMTWSFVEGLEAETRLIARRGVVRDDNADTISASSTADQCTGWLAGTFLYVQALAVVTKRWDRSA